VVLKKILTVNTLTTTQSIPNLGPEYSGPFGYDGAAEWKPAMGLYE
jgi:hypothetical protein